MKQRLFFLSQPWGEEVELSGLLQGMEFVTSLPRGGFCPHPPALAV